MPIWQAPLLEYLIFALVSFSTSLLATATLVNVTVDDSEILNGSAAITYAPLTGWNNGADCASCDARPDPSRTWGGTWHDSTYPGGGENHILSASLIFNGSAIYVFCIISHSTTKPSGNSNMTFFIDGGAVGGYFLAPSGSETYDYNVLVYANNSLTPGTHSLTVQNGAVGAPKSLMLLDYIVYS
ncbi:hypothetical protein BDW22DRAFT_1327404 [Trametopsis cervina]|nr:hypothetical protein BDW22DRAFT_1327404 [Trametopsis cervina]